MGNVWQQQAPTVPGYYWVRYVDIQGIPKEPDIMWLVEEGRAFEFGCEHSWTPGVGCFEYGPKIEPPNAKSQATDAALSRQVACTDGLCGNGSKVGAGDTAMKGKQ